MTGREQASLETLLDVYDRVLDSVIVAHEQVAMDTPQDKALHARAVQEFRAAQRRLREARRG